MNDLTNLPDPSRLIFGLRDTGYDFNTAAADIIDNSIAADAEHINIRVELHADGRKFVMFGDDGKGMDEEALFAAMRYGAPARENAKSLGKFGLGLKTASSSICLRFTLISRKSADVPLSKLAWDLEHVQEENRWEMLQEPVTRAEEDAFDELCGDTGTLLIWSKCDRLLSKNYAEPAGAAETKAVNNRVKKLREHVALVFHRFLDEKDARCRNVRIAIDEEVVSPWNPFYPQRSVQALPDNARELKIELPEGSTETAHMNAWLLPHAKEMTKNENDTYAKISSRAQGFYIYREGRLIHNGGWLGVFRSDDPHYSLLRVEFDFGHELDDAFKIDVKKSRILFDPALEDALKERLATIYREADQRYRRKKKQLSSELEVDHSGSNNSIKDAKFTKKPSVQTATPGAQDAVVNNNRGAGIKIHVPVQANVDPGSVYVEAVTDITSGRLWEPALRSASNTGFTTGVRINRHHDFYQKIYLKAASLGYAVEGMDILLWAFSAAEQNNTDEELQPIFEDIRQEISGNLEKLLRDTPLPTDTELDELSESAEDVE
ncbi:histidine kinase/DNA gyrase B/HSP90-like ATPase [Sphingomonas sp. PP-F2F-A104-K0414]|uniref:ATP-binding protein n=1 Tax=Sphingomonas sp. PP-F2F-A104-K0414 TaxID=2135661 RepID=UPI001051B17A|nr:ATP-binding protein [Sphingomonas sp. PP-F2F-A104-K0414]TCP99544.1 histidine kinase/DNA gyrase B/HSP90-like ATPase [Sphingomonas sp. PP-F2F-A104-K0414]